MKYFVPKAIATLRTKHDARRGRFFGYAPCQGGVVDVWRNYRP